MMKNALTVSATFAARINIMKMAPAFAIPDGTGGIATNLALIAALTDIAPKIGAIVILVGWVLIVAAHLIHLLATMRYQGLGAVG